MILTQHRQEWLESGVSEVIIDLNVESLDDAREIDQRLNRNVEKRWQHWKHGAGWGVGGIDPKTGERTLLGYQFKPDTPILDGNKADGTTPKYKKYVGATGQGQAVPLFLDIGIDGYWSRVLQHAEIPVVITEGGKKAGSLLSRDIAAISIPGVTCGQKGDRIKEPLIDFCSVGRKVYLAFDADLYKNPDVFRALDKLGRLASAEGAVVYVLTWDAAIGKGIDDYLANGGDLDELFRTAQTFAEWRVSQQEAQPKKHKYSFYQEVLRELYLTKGSYICVQAKIYKWCGTYYRECFDEDETRRIWQYCDGYQQIDKETVSYPYASPGYITKALTWIKAALSVPPELVNPPGLNCTNGVLHIIWEGSTPRWELKPHSPANHYIYEPQVEFKPDAPSEDCDRLLSALEPAERDIFLKTIAASLDLSRVRKVKGRIRALLLKGTGANGKDTLREVVQMMYGRQGVTGCAFGDFSQYDQGRKFPLSKLQYSKVNWASENSSIPALDQLQSLKQVITGDDIDFEGKGKDERSGPTRCVLLFNCNEAPNIQAALDAIKTRFAVISFEKTFKAGADTSKGEIEADARFKYDPAFVQARVLPAFLNKVLDALSRLMAEGLDYSATDGALQAIQNENCHLFQFCADVDLGYVPGGYVHASEIWDELEKWYLTNGTLSLTENGKKEWTDQVKRSDKNVKGINQVLSRFLELFPKAKRGNRTNRGIKIEGLAFRDRQPEREDDLPPSDHDEVGVLSRDHNDSSCALNGSKGSEPKSDHKRGVIINSEKKHFSEATSHNSNGKNGVDPQKQKNEQEPQNREHFNTRQPSNADEIRSDMSDLTRSPLNTAQHSTPFMITPSDHNEPPSDHDEVLGDDDDDEELDLHEWRRRYGN